MEWIKCSDKNPGDLDAILFTDGREIFKGYRMSSSTDDWFAWYCDNDSTIYDVTHWMPLPNSPKE
jgi:hypothetical protein